MVNVYTKYNGSLPVITQCDAWFDAFIDISDLDERCEEYIRKIDKAEIIDRNSWTVRTQFGVTDISNLSTGLKTLLIIRVLKLKGESAVVCIDECGTNVKTLVLEEADNSNISLLAHYCGFDLGIEKEFLVDDKHHCRNTVELLERIYS